MFKLPANLLSASKILFWIRFSDPPTGIGFQIIQLLLMHQIRSDQTSPSVVSDSLWPHESQHIRPPCPSPTPGDYPSSCSLSWRSNHLILYHPLPLLPSIFPNIKVFSDESAFRVRWPKYWSFSFNIKQKTAYEMVVCDWSSDVCSSDLCLTLCDPMNRRTLGLPVHHQHPEFTQTHEIGRASCRERV